MNWDAMTARERDAAVAEALGFRIEPGWLVYPDGGKQSIQGMPHYTTEPAASKLVLNEVERRGLQDEYTAELIGLVVGGTDGWGKLVEILLGQLFSLLRATPDQQCQAALMAMGIL